MLIRMMLFYFLSLSYCVYLEKKILSAQYMFLNDIFELRIPHSTTRKSSKSKEN
jgi:hypothetical protein